MNSCRRVSATPNEDDLQALLGDWQAVAGDMDAAFRETGERVAEAQRHGQAQG